MGMSSYCVAGVTADMRSKMESIRYVKSWYEKSVDFKCDDNRECHAVYAIMAFGRSSDKTSIDFIHAHYKLDFKIAPKIIERRKQNSILWGLYNWESIEYRKEEYALGMRSKSLLDNYVRYQVLKGFYNEGFISSVNQNNAIDYDEDY